ncbi:MAG: CarD family transcriptional regulator, partial [Microcystaceae cyanobacterium]
TQEEAGRWATHLEAMGWKTVNFYPTSEASPYEPFNPESEMIWGQMQVLSVISEQLSAISEGQSTANLAIVATERALQPHLPPPEVFRPYFMSFNLGMVQEAKSLDESLARLGYERVPLVETEGQWSRRGDLVDIFPVSAELPVRLEWFGDELEQLREFDPSTQRSLDKIEQLTLTPTTFAPIIAASIETPGEILADYLSTEDLDALATGNLPEGMQRFLGFAFEKPASLLEYLPENTLCVFDEVEQCCAHSDRWVEYAEEQRKERVGIDGEDINSDSRFRDGGEKLLPKIHRSFTESLAEVAEKFPIVYLSELAEENSRLPTPHSPLPSFNLSSRPIPTTPHQFAKLAEILRGKREIYSGISLNNYAIWLISAQPSRSVSLLQEHDCPAQFIPNPSDYPAIDKFQTQHTAVALKYSGLAELEGFILPTFRIVVVTDREFFGQHVLATAGFIRKRRRATSKQVDLNKLRPGDYVVHKSHGIGKFLKLESLETREYLVIQYADGLLRVPADSFDTLSRYRHTGNRPPELNKMSGKAW